MRKNVSFALAVAVGWLLGSQTLWAQEHEHMARAELAKALKSANVSLEKGLLASEREGKPISGKFELDEGKLQLSLYTMKGDKFSEVIVDHKTGKISKVETITGGDDLAAAKTQSEAMAKAKRSLHAAVATAMKANKGYHAVSITPTVKDGHPTAEITLVKGDEWKTVSEKLD